MKQYGALRAISGILKLVGWLIIIVGVVVLAAIMFKDTGPSYSNPYISSTGASFIAVLIALSIMFSGLMVLATGQLIEAVADIAVNTAHLPALTQNSERTVGFFEHISAKANGPKPSAPVQAKS